MRAVLSVLVLACMFATAAAGAPAAPATPTAPVAAGPPSDDVIRQKIVGSWGQTVDCNDGSLTFKSDGTFASRGANEPDGVTGTYAIDKGRLSGENGDGDMPVMLVNFDGDALLLDDGSGNPQRLARCQTAQ